MSTTIAPQVGQEATLPGVHFGRTWKIGRLTLAVWNGLLDWARPKLPNPHASLERVIDRVSPEAAALLMREANDAAVRMQSLKSPEVRYLVQETPEGQVEQFYQLLRAVEGQGEVTREQAWEIMAAIGDAERKKALEKAEGRLPPPPNAGGRLGQRSRPAGKSRGGRSRGS